MITVDERYIGYHVELSGPPAYDPDESAPCLVCGEAWTEQTVRTISLMAIGGNRSLFYRVHRRCHDLLTMAEEEALDNAVLTCAGAWHEEAQS